MAQVRVIVDAPQAIAQGNFSVDFDPEFFGDIVDVQVFSAAGEATGKAIIEGKHAVVTFTSPSGGVGRLPELPIATITIPVLPNVAIAAAGTVTIQPGTGRWKDPSGNNYDVTTEPGSVSPGTFSIQNVEPGGGLLPTGTVLRIEGSGFTPGTVVEIPGVLIANPTFTSPAEMLVTLAGPAEMTGKIVRATNSDGDTTVYVSGLRAPPSDPSTSGLRPFFPIRTYGSIDLGIFPGRPYGLRGFALQNPTSTPAEVTLERVAFQGPGKRIPITIPAFGTYVAYLFSIGVQSLDQVGLLANTPVRGVILSNAGPPTEEVVSEPSSPYAPFQPSPQISVSPSQITLQFQTGTPAPGPWTVTVFGPSRSMDPVNVTATATAANGGSWLSVSPAQFSVQSLQAATLNVRANPAGLSPGTYQGSVSVLPSVPGATASVIPVTLTVSDRPFIEVTDLGNTYFTTVAGDSQMYSGRISIASTGANVPITITAKTDPGGDWFSLTSTPATTPATIAFSVKSAGLPVGYYNAFITVTGPSNTVTAGVGLSVTGTPAVTLQSLSPSALSFSVQAGGTNLTRGATVQVNPFTVGYDFAVESETNSGGDWLSASALRVGAGGLFEVRVNATSLAPGTYTGAVVVKAPGKAQGTLRLPVTLTVWSHVQLSVSPTSLRVAPSADVNVTSGGVPVEVSIGFDVAETFCSAFESPSTDRSPPTLLTPFTLTVRCTSPGDYDRTLILKAGDQTVNVPMLVHVDPPPYRGITMPPVISAIVNAASNRQGSIAPAEIIAIHGTGVGGSTSTRVLMNGAPATVLYSSVFQTNVTVPSELAGSTKASIQIEVDGSISAPISVPLAPSALGIFTLTSSGVGQSAVLNQDNSVNGAENAAARGSIIQIFGTGTGGLNSVRVTIGEADAEVTFAGAAPAAVTGLLQVNARVPLTISPGTAVPVILKAGDAQSQPGATIAVR